METPMLTVFTGVCSLLEDPRKRIYVRLILKPFHCEILRLEIKSGRRGDTNIRTL
jgi:hypothetical protein